MTTFTFNDLFLFPKAIKAAKPRLLKTKDVVTHMEAVK